MHILLGLLGSLISLLFLLDRLGIDLGGLNPFAWRRRSAWRQKFEANPIFTLHDPRDMAAVLLVGAAKIDGDLTASEKSALLSEFESAFSLDGKAAAELLGSTVYLLGNMQVINDQIDDLLIRYREHLGTAQIQSLLQMLDRIVALDGGATTRQSELLAAIRARLEPVPGPQGTWH